MKKCSIEDKLYQNWPIKIFGWTVKEISHKKKPVEKTTKSFH